MTIDELDPATAPPEALRAHAELSAVIDAERRTPGWPAPTESYVRKLRVPRPGRAARHWVAREDGRVIGRSTTSWRTTPDNPQQVEIDVAVHPDFRSRGVGTALLRPAIDAARSLGRSLVTNEVLHGGPGAVFAKARGAEERAIDRRSVLDVASLDLDAIAVWGQPHADAAQRYELVHWRGGCPPELLADMARLYTAMNDAPRQDLEREDELYTPALVAENDARAARRGYDRWTTGARHAGSGRLVAMTEIEISVDWPEWAFQGDTVVLRDDRGHGLGRWLKAENLRRVLADRPDVVGVQAFNAVTNRHMLAINEALGFRAAELWGEWQVALDVLDASLRGQG